MSDDGDYVIHFGQGACHTLTDDGAPGLKSVRHRSAPRQMAHPIGFHHPKPPEPKQVKP